MKIIIRNNTELLDFIKREEVTVLQGIEVVTKGLNVLCLTSEKTKEELIKETEAFIKNYCQNDKIEHSIFLEKLRENITMEDILSHPVTKKISDKFDEKY